ncbi:antiholin-like protein LrgA [mine drainage metagenome]|uniref:Antiholin-like protein LrgA n=1 Tax=mine drainage metagenome TaxID=410659 RepID=A0A1J5TRC0_9ZZZZ
MILGLVQILFFQSLGELVSKFVFPSLPGPVIGLVLLLIWLVINKNISESLAFVADGFSKYLGILFVPAAVGVVLFLPQLKANAVPIVGALVVSVVLTIACSALVLKLLTKKTDTHE